MDLHDPYMFMEWVVVGWWVVLQVVWLDYLSNQIQILKNCHFGLKKKSLPTQMDLYDPHMVSYRIH